jgi:hypothetical protein
MEQPRTPFTPEFLMRAKRTILSIAIAACLSMSGSIVASAQVKFKIPIAYIDSIFKGGGGDPQDTTGLTFRRGPILSGSVFTTRQQFAEIRSAASRPIGRPPIPAPSSSILCRRYVPMEKIFGSLRSTSFNRVVSLTVQRRTSGLTLGRRKKIHFASEQ